MTKRRWILVSVLAALAAPGAAMAQDASKMSFFITSVGSGKGGDLGGLEGADKHCQQLASAVGAGNKTWRAYLSAAPQGGKPAVHARDRIGKGPWFNAKGVQVAANVDDLHSDNNKLSKENSLTEKGTVVNGRGDTPNQHDILTGSTAEGRLAEPEPGTPDQPAPENLTCNNWTSSGPNRAIVGHHDRTGGGAAPTSWNASHATRSCSQEDLIATGGNGYFYCFATN
jgi:hypothetical protein